MTFAVHPQPILSYEGRLHSAPAFIHKTKSEKAVSPLFRYSLMDVQPYYAYFLCKTIDPEFPDICKMSSVWSIIPCKHKNLCIALL